MNIRFMNLMLSIVMLVIPLLIVPQDTARAQSEKPPQFYVSLGNSLAAGVQKDKKDGTLLLTDDAYTDQIYQRIKGHYQNLVHEKLGCPGETSTTMINGGMCPYPAGSQLAQALEFLAAHPGEIAFITIDIGANDLLACDVTTPDLEQCIATAFGQAGFNLMQILTALQSAAPGVPIIGLNYYNPNLALWLNPGGPGGEGLATLTTQVVLQFSETVLVPVYGSFGVPVADVTAAFDTGDFTLVGGIPHNVRVICQLTWMCDPPPVGPDIHPNKNGYKVIARTVEQLMKELGIF